MLTDKLYIIYEKTGDYHAITTKTYGIGHPLPVNSAV